MGHIPEELEYTSNQQNTEEKPFIPEHPLHHRIISWILIAIVLFGFLGTCYWLAFYGV